MKPNFTLEEIKDILNDSPFKEGVVVKYTGPEVAHYKYGKLFRVQRVIYSFGVVCYVANNPVDSEYLEIVKPTLKRKLWT